MAHCIKISISLELSLFDELNRQAHEQQVSRSHLLAQAMSEYFERLHNQDLKARIDEAYADGPDDAELAVLRYAKQQQRQVLRDTI